MAPFFIVVMSGCKKPLDQRTDCLALIDVSFDFVAILKSRHELRQSSRGAYSR